MRFDTDNMKKGQDPAGQRREQAESADRSACCVNSEGVVPRQCNAVVDSFVVSGLMLMARGLPQQRCQGTSLDGTKP